MIEIKPFRALLYNTEKVNGDDVTSPPYDVIDNEQRDALYQKSPYNIIRIDFGKETDGDITEDKYVRAKNYLNNWITEGILKRDDEDSIYIYEIEYKLNGKPLCLKGVLALMRLQELGHGIYPHEATHSKPKADRLNLLKTCHANISPIFTLYRANNDLSIASYQQIFVSRQDDGTLHRLYKVSDSKVIKTLSDALKDSPILIADGHHRYEVSLQFKKLVESGDIKGLKNTANGNNPWDYVLTYLVNINNSDLTILPTHRLIKDKPSLNILNALQKHFEITRYHFIDSNSIQDAIQKSGKGSFGLYLGNHECYLIKYKGNALHDLPKQLRDVDTVVLHELILKEDLHTEEITYEMDINKAIQMVDNKVFNALFILNHTPVEEIEEVALANLRMPPKSTYFYPKLLTGMAIYSFF